MPRKVVKTMTITATGFTAPIISAPPHPGLSSEKSEVCAFGDLTKTNVVAGPMSYSDIQVVALDEGSANPPLPGTVYDITFATVYTDGIVAEPPTRSFNRKCSVVTVEPGVVAVDGERKAMWTITLSPVGGDDPGTLGMGIATSGN